MRTEARAALIPANVPYGRLVIPTVLIGCLLWSYWPTIVELREIWAASADYSVGQLVPLVALYLVWRVRHAPALRESRPNGWGLALVVASQLLRFAGIYYAYASAERLSFVLAISGIILLTAGRRAWRKLIWVQAFLLLMMPLPQRVHELISLPLQNCATRMGLFGLELLGFYAVREGNVLHLEEQTTVMVAEACSGLRMLTAFIFAATVMTFLVYRPPWQKAVLLLSSIPIAVVTNGVRVLASSIFMYYVKDTALGQGFHDLAGLLMMPVAVAFLVAEVLLLRVLADVFGTPPPASAQGGAGRQPRCAEAAPATHVPAWNNAQRER